MFLAFNFFLRESVHYSFVLEIKPLTASRDHREVLLEVMKLHFCSYRSSLPVYGFIQDQMLYEQ